MLALVAQLDAELTSLLCWSFAQHELVSLWHHISLLALSHLAWWQVVTFAIFTALIAAMANTIAKHRHYLFMQRPSSGIARRAKWDICFMADSAQPQTNPLTLAELLEHADQDGANSMVYFIHYTSRCSIEHNIRPWL